MRLPGCSDLERGVVCKEEVRERSLVEERDVQGSVQQRRIDLGALNISLCVQELGLDYVLLHVQVLNLDEKSIHFQHTIFLFILGYKTKIELECEYRALISIAVIVSVFVIFD